MGDLNRRRGIVAKVMEDSVFPVSVIRAEVPLGENFGYATDVTLNVPQGRAELLLWSFFRSTPKRQ